jgi:hypothetical protein
VNFTRLEEKMELLFFYNVKVSKVSGEIAYLDEEKDE